MNRVLAFGNQLFSVSKLYAGIPSVLTNSVGAMISRISRNSKRIIAVLSQYRSPSQIAMGVAIGIALGLVPKDNLVAISLIAMIACLRVNQLAACTTAISLSLVNPWFNPVTTAIGSTLLEQPMIFSSILYLYQYPVLPWTCLENVLVLGGIGLGISTLIPSCAICFWLFSKANQKMESLALEQVANEAIEYRKSVTEQSRTRQEKPLPTLKLISDEESIANADKTAATNDPNPHQHSTTIQRVEPSSNSLNKPKIRIDRQSKQRSMPTIFTGEVLPDGNDTFLRETVIEVIRYRNPVPAARGSIQEQKDPLAVPQMQGNSMPIGNVSTIASNDANHGVASPSKGLVGQSINYDLGHSASQAGNRDESLKYLLWHINGSKESVRKSSEKTA